jgi:transcriptional regulator with XRE-family HTH domain
MLFSILQIRLVATLQERVRCGELTERGLARQTGISHPHIHHVLKGAKALSLRSADRILRHLGISVLDLLESRELERPGLPSVVAHTVFRGVPALDGLLGPGHPFPRHVVRTDTYPFPEAEIAGLESPVVGRLAHDSQMAGLFNAGSLVLLDRSASKRTQLVSGGMYALSWRGQGLLRYVKREGSQLKLIPAGGVRNSASWDSISLSDKNILDVVQAEAIWIGRRLEPLPIAE